MNILSIINLYLAEKYILHIRIKQSLQIHLMMILNKVSHYLQILSMSIDVILYLLLLTGILYIIFFKIEI